MASFAMKKQRPWPREDTEASVQQARPADSPWYPGGMAAWKRCKEEITLILNVDSLISIINTLT